MTLIRIAWSSEARLAPRSAASSSSAAQGWRRGLCGSPIARASESGAASGSGKAGSPRQHASRGRLATRRSALADSLTLEHFLLRDKGVKLWRDFLRATRNIPNPMARRETIDWLRNEHFEGLTGLRTLTDVTRIREQLVAGNVALKRVCGPMELASALLPQHGSFPKLRGRKGEQAL